MCGIVGLINYQKEDCETLLHSLEHRGKDARGIIEQDNVILGHNRLSINDLSSAGNQPFIYKGLHLVVNGEIWNYPQLRKEYEERGYQFFSNSDSEIILYLYEERELNRLDGMFSFILHDTNIQKLFISRDWVGKIPLFIDVTNKIMIASEFGSIKDNYPNSKPKFVKPNTLVIIDTKTLSLKEEKEYYFRWNRDELQPRSYEEVTTKLFKDVQHAVDKRLISDVPIATSLSGGIDSSVITYFLKQRIPNLKAYTIKFEEDSEDLKNARIVAKSIGVELIEVEIPKDKEKIIQRTKEVLKTINYPLNVQLQVGVLQSYIAEKMKEDGIKVAFSGEGADESFGSYETKRSAKFKPYWNDLRKDLHNAEYYKNLLRGNTIFMKFGTIELRCPFYDKEIVNYITNIPTKWLTDKEGLGKMMKYPLQIGFKDIFPQEIIEQKKRAFQKGTNFKDWYEDIIMNSKYFNPKELTNMSSILSDWFEREYHYSHRKLKDDINQNIGIYKWMV